jgi:hypothetical protein
VWQLGRALQGDTGGGAENSQEAGSQPEAGEFQARKFYPLLENEKCPKKYYKKSNLTFIRVVQNCAANL